MSLTALIVLLVYFAGLVLGVFYQPIFALFSYLWIFYNDPNTNWWGALIPDLRYSFVAAIVALVVALVQAKPAEPWLKTPVAKLLIAYALWMWIQSAWAIDAYVHREGAILFTKYVVLSFVIYNLCATQRNVELFLWAHVAGCFIFGWIGFNSVVITRLETIGGPGVDDANLLAAHMVTGLVVAGFLFIHSKGYWKWAAFAALPFILNTIILTQSRGGFLALIGAGGAAWYLAPAAYKRVVTLAGALGVVLFLILANDFFWDRISTIFESEGTAAQETRVKLIGPQLAMFADYPLGAGHRGNELLSPRYMPEELLSNSGRRSAHNTFMAALVDQGIPGAVILLLFYGWAGVTFKRLKKMDRLGLPPSLGILRASLGAALASMFVSGLFLNLLKTEVQIWLISLTASLVVLSERAVKLHQTGGEVSATIDFGDPSKNHV